MKELIPFFIILFLGYATGIFYVLSMIEKPIWKYMYTSEIFSNETLMRQIHGQLKRLITLLPPTMVTSMLFSTILIIYQYLTLNSISSFVLLIVFLIQIVRLVILLKGRIKDVQSIESNAEYKTLNKGVIKLAQLHHEGLFMTLVSFILQLWVVTS